MHIALEGRNIDISNPETMSETDRELLRDNFMCEWRTRLAGFKTKLNESVHGFSEEQTFFFRALLLVRELRFPNTKLTKGNRSLDFGNFTIHYFCDCTMMYSHLVLRLSEKDARKPFICFEYSCHCQGQPRYSTSLWDVDSHHKRAFTQKFRDAFDKLEHDAGAMLAHFGPHVAFTAAFGTDSIFATPTWYL